LTYGDPYAGSAFATWQVLETGQEAHIKNSNVIRKDRNLGHPDEKIENQKPKFTTAEAHAMAAQFHMGFAVQMINCGRMDEANEALVKAHEQMQLIRDAHTAKIIKEEVFG